MSNAVNGSKYPKEIFVSQKSTDKMTQTFSITSELSWKEDKPLSMDNISRLVVTGIDKFPTGGKNICVANIPAEDIFCIYDAYRECMTVLPIKSMLAKNNNKPASTDEAQKMAQMGVSSELCEVLKNAPKIGMNKDKPYYSLSREALEKHRDFLQSNVATYPNNQKEIDLLNSILATDINLYNRCVAYITNNTASSGSATADEVFVIYESEIKPRMSVRNAAGENQVYQIKIIYDASRKYPFRFEIMNAFAQVKRFPDGRMNIMMKNGLNDRKTVTVNLSSNDGRKAINNMFAALNNFRNSTFKKQYDLAQQININNINAAKANQNAVPTPAPLPPQGYTQYNPAPNQYPAPDPNQYQQYVPANQTNQGYQGYYTTQKS